MDLLYSGLVNVLGTDRVVLYPARPKYFEGVPVSTGDKEKDYGAERRSLGYVKGNTPLYVDAVEIRQMLQRQKIGLIVTDEREDSYRLYLSLSAQFFDVPVIVVAGHDKFWAQSPETVKQQYGKNFRLLFSDLFEERYVELPYFRPYNWSVNFDHLWDPKQRQKFLNDKKYDICFSGFNSHPDRLRFVEHVYNNWTNRGLKIKVFLETRPNTMEAFDQKAKYFEDIARSRICLNLRGAATTGKTMRFWEIPYVGSFMLSQRFTMALNPFMEGSHCAYFSDENEFDRKVDQYLSFESFRENAAHDANIVATKWCTSEERARQVLGWTGEYLGQTSTV